MAKVKFIECTSTEYETLTNKEEGTLYFLSDTNEVYKGTTKYAELDETIESDTLRINSSNEVTKYDGTTQINTLVLGKQTSNQSAQGSFSVIGTTDWGAGGYSIEECKLKQTIYDSSITDTTNIDIDTGLPELVFIETNVDSDGNIDTNNVYTDRALKAKDIFDAWGDNDPYVETYEDSGVTYTHTYYPVWYQLLPKASANKQGAVKVGDGLSIDDNGVLSASGSSSSSSVEDDTVRYLDTGQLVKYDGSTGLSNAYVGTIKSGTTLGNYAFSSGYNNTASGNNSHAEGSGNKASGSNSHVEGVSSTASGTYSHAEGNASTASKTCSHAEGASTASGEYSHAEGRGSKASGNNSHAEGYTTTASGSYSHAEGYATTALGSASHAEGYYTKASSSYQHVSGKYNVGDPSNTYIEIVGNGTSDSARSNARTLDWNGNEVLAGTLTTGGSITIGSTTITEEQLQQLLASLG